MSGTQMSKEPVTQVPTPATVGLKLEVVVIPVSDVDRAKRFYENLGWRVDADFAAGDNWRVVQMTPPGSPCSIHFGKGVTKAVPGQFKTYILWCPTSKRRGRSSSVGAPLSVRHSISPASAERPCAGPPRTVTPTQHLPRSAIRTDHLEYRDRRCQGGVRAAQGIRSDCRAQAVCN